VDKKGIAKSNTRARARRGGQHLSRLEKIEVENMSFEDMRLSLTAADCKDGDIMEVSGKIEEKILEAKNGGQYTKFIVPVKDAKNQEWTLWLMPYDVMKIARAKGRKLSEYLGSKLVLEINEAENDEGEKILTKKGQQVYNIGIKEVKK